MPFLARIPSSTWIQLIPFLLRAGRAGGKIVIGRKQDLQARNGRKVEQTDKMPGLLLDQELKYTNEAAIANAAFLNADLRRKYATAMKNYYENLHRAQDNPGYVTPPGKPEVPFAWITIEQTGPAVGEDKGLLTLYLSPVDRVCEPIVEPAPPPPPPSGIVKVGAEIPPPLDAPGQRWFQVLLGDTVPEGEQVEQVGAKYQKRSRSTWAGKAYYYLLLN